MEQYKIIEIGNEVWFDEAGNKILRRNIKDIVVARDEVVRELSAKAEDINRQIKEFKKEAFEKLDQFLDKSFERYGVKAPEGKGNITFKTFNGTYKIQIKNVSFIEFDETIHAAKKLIDNCLKRWASGADQNLQIVVNDAFKVDKKGNLDKAAILKLTTYEIDDEEWKAAMEAIRDSIRESFRRRYMNFYRRLEDTDFYGLISLDFAKI